MVKSDEKQMYRIYAQKEGLTAKFDTNETTVKEIKETVVDIVLGDPEKSKEYQRYVVLPITTKERWEEGCINFCPRCGANISDYSLGNFAITDCFECDANIDVYVKVYDDNE